MHQRDHYYEVWFYDRITGWYRPGDHSESLSEAADDLIEAIDKTPIPSAWPETFVVERINCQTLTDVTDDVVSVLCARAVERGMTYEDDHPIAVWIEEHDTSMGRLAKDGSDLIAKTMEAAE
ncbi:MAG: hypothetical protein D6773_07835 [Alphaproteobacteria bacterium]|nr:MAG: hypothetical protein D6773_07835 [Alphaproteobacteria bacterium]